MLRRLTSHLLVALVAATSGAACAAEPLPPQDRPEAFQKLDTDKDGYISRKEAAVQPEVAANFDKADRNRDGRLSPEEFESVPLNRSDQPGTFRAPERG
jgi:hypothetical protein